MEEYRGCYISQNQYGYFTFPRNTNSGYLHSDGVRREKTYNESHEYTGYFKTVEDVKKAIDKYHELRTSDNVLNHRETKQKENKGNTMNKREAIRAMCDGKKVTKSHWPKDEYLVMTNTNDIKDIDGYGVDMNEYDDIGWEIYNEYNLDVYEAFKAVLDGKKVQHESWKDGGYIYCDSGYMLDSRGDNFYGWGVTMYKTGWKIIQ